MEEEKKVVKDKNPFKVFYDKLSAPIEEKFIINYEEDGKKFKGYNAQAAINRLNEVVGLGNWKAEGNIRKEEIIGKAWAVSMDVTITIFSNDRIPRIFVQGSGGAYAKNIANAYKGARTSAFKNACRYLGIGKELYEQNQLDDDIDINQSGAPSSEETATPVAIPEEAVILEKKINDCKNLDQLQSLEETVKAVKEPSVQKIIFKKYNAKKISLLV
jgi:hypothetical protein